MKEGVRGEEGAERKIKMVFPPFSFVLESYRVSGLAGFKQLLSITTGGQQRSRFTRPIVNSFQDSNSVERQGGEIRSMGTRYSGGDFGR